MRDLISVEDEVQNMKDHLERCFEKDFDHSSSPKKPTATTETGETKKLEPFRRILREDDLISAEENLHLKYEYQKWIPGTSKNSESKFSFWAFHKWKRYIDAVLKPPKSNDGLF